MSDQVDTAWGRVAEDGTVFVRTSNGERAVGQWPGGDPVETLALFQRRYAGLRVEVELLERRIRDRRVAGATASAAVAKLRAQVADAQAVGDLDALLDRLIALDALLAEQRRELRAERAARAEQARERKEALVSEAEKLAAGTSWRTNDTAMKELLAEWKTLDRLDKDTDTALWRRLSAARTALAAARKQHYSQLADRRAEARQRKEQLVTEAEALAESRDWAATPAKFRELMQRWKTAGSAQKAVDERLWERFRAAQDRFFTARNEANAAADAEFTENAKRKDALLAEAEALLPIDEPRAARSAFRDIARRWDETGKVPRAAVQSYEGRFRKVEQAVLASEDDRWRRGNPEALARAEETVGKLEASIAQLETALASARLDGNADRIEETEQALAARRSWLEQATRARDEFAGT